MELQEMLTRLKRESPQRIAVAAAQDQYVLQAVAQAKQLGIAQPVLCGQTRKIREMAVSMGISLDGMELLEAESEQEAAALAVSLVREKKADTLMKGILHTDVLLRAVLDKEHGLRGGGILSHVGVIRSPILNRTLYLTDCAMVTYPDVAAKVQLIHNAVTVARHLGVAEPKVAVLAAVEVVNPAMQATLDAAVLTQMNRRGQIKHCVVDGPLAMDLAISKDAVAHKGITSPVAGQADVLLFPDIDAANPVMKTFTLAGNSIMGGVIMGAKAPVVLTSRSDSEESKLYSIACAAMVALGGR